MKTKLFYLALIIILFCGCEKREIFICDCGETEKWSELGYLPGMFFVVEFKNNDLANHIYVVPDETKTYNEFICSTPSFLNDNPKPFIHITDNHYLVNWNWVVTSAFCIPLNDNYSISNKWNEWYQIDAITKKKSVKKPIKRVKFIFAHTINDYLKNKNININIEENLADRTNTKIDGKPIITDEKWNNLSQEEKEYYLKKFDSYEENYNNTVEALKHLLNEEDSDKYFFRIFPAYYN